MATYLVNYRLMVRQSTPTGNQVVGVATFNALDSSSLGSVQTDFQSLTWIAGNVLSFTAASNSTTLTFTDLTASADSPSVNWDLDTVTVAGQTTAGSVPEPASILLLAAH